MPLLLGRPRRVRLARRLLADGVPARRGRAGELRAAAPDRARHHRGHDPRGPRVGALARVVDRACPRIRAGAAAAPTRPAGSRRSRAHDRRAAAAAARPTPASSYRRRSRVRAAMLGVLALVLFGVIFFRLWYLQILSGDQYLQQANANRIARTADAGAARRNRRPRRQAAGHQPRRQRRPDRDLGAARQRACAPRGLLTASARVLGMSPRRIEALVGKGYAEAPLRAGHDQDGRRAAARSRSSPSARANSRASCSSRCGSAPTRSAKWPRRCSATSARSTKRSSRSPPSAACSRGRSSARRARVLLRPLPARQARRAALRGQRGGRTGAGHARSDRRRQAGYNLKLTIDRGLQKASEEALREGIASARASGKPATSGAYVAMDPLQRRNPRDRLLPELQPERLREAAHAGRIRVAHGQRRTSAKVQKRRRRSRTGPPKGSIRPAPPSSRSRRWRRSKAAF